MSKQKIYTKDEIIKRQKLGASILIGIICVLGLVCIFKTFESLRYQIVLDGVKDEFKDFTVMQVEMLSYCIEQGELNEDIFFDDFLRFKAEQIIADK